MATCSPGTKPARSIARTSVSSACSLVAKAGHQPPSSATPCSVPRCLHQLRRPRGRPRPSSPAPAAKLFGAGAHDHEVLDVDAPSGMRAAAEDLDLRHRQHRARRRRRGSDTAARPRTRRRHARPPSTPPAWRWRRAAILFGVPSSSIRRAVQRRLVGGVEAGDRARRSRRSRGRPRASRRSRRTPSPPSRRSSASPVPVDAPAGTMARPTPPPSSSTSASTVGRPRLSQTRRACTKAIVVSVMRRAPSSRPGAHRRVSRPDGQPAVRARRAAPGSCRGSVVMYSTGDLPSTRASNSPGSRCAARRSSAAAAPSRRDPGRPRPAHRSRPGSPRVAAGVHRHFSSRWFRQNARSKAGSPHQAHSASRNTGPPGRAGCSSG